MAALWRKLRKLIPRTPSRLTNRSGSHQRRHSTLRRMYGPTMGAQTASPNKKRGTTVAPPFWSLSAKPTTEGRCLAQGFDQAVRRWDPSESWLLVLGTLDLIGAWL